MSRHTRRRTGRWAAAAIVLSMLGSHASFGQPSSAIINQAVTPPVGTASSEDIRDIRGPKPLPSPWTIPLLVMAGLVVTGGGWAVWWWNRRRQHVVAKLPSQIALERLERARALMHPTGARDFSIEVSDIVRHYIESRFHMRAAHRTTDEFLHDLLESEDTALAAHRELLADFLQSCDLAKFGGWNLPESDMDAMLQGARRFVLDSGPPRATRKPMAKSSSAAGRESYDSVPTT